VKKGASFFVLGALLVGTMFPAQVFGVRNNQILVTAKVLEHLTYLKNNNKTELATNTKYTPFAIEKDGLILMSLNY
jgi:hypothetical protein